MSKKLIIMDFKLKMIKNWLFCIFKLKMSKNWSFWFWRLKWVKIDHLKFCILIVILVIFIVILVILIAILVNHIAVMTSRSVKIILVCNTDFFTKSPKFGLYLVCILRKILYFHKLEIKKDCKGALTEFSKSTLKAEHPARVPPLQISSLQCKFWNFCKGPPYRSFWGSSHMSINCFTTMSLFLVTIFFSSSFT